MRSLESRIEKLEQLATLAKQPETPKIFIDFSEVHEALSKLQADREMTFDEIIADIQGSDC